MDPLDVLTRLRSKRIASLPDWAQEAIQKSDDPVADAVAAQIAHRIVTRYGGPARLRLIVSLFERCEGIDVVAREFKVTKQRISQWRRALGFTEEKFVLRGVVQEALRRGSRYDPA